MIELDEQTKETITELSTKCPITMNIIMKINDEIKLTLKETMLVFGIIKRENTLDIKSAEDLYLSLIDEKFLIPFDEFLSQLEENTEYNLCANFCNNSLCISAKALNIKTPFTLLDMFYCEKFDETEVKNQFLYLYQGDLIFNQDLKRFYFYEEGKWKVVEQNILVGKILDMMEIVVLESKKVTESNATKIYKRLSSASELIYQGEFNTNKFLLNVKNGVFDLMNNKFINHDSSYYHSYQFPIEFDPKADCPLFKEKFAEIFPDDQESIDFLRSWMLYLMIRSYEHQKILFMIGEKGRNGKSLITELITEMLSKELVTNQSIEDLSSNKHYSKVQLENKFMNVTSETSFEALESNIIKNLTGGDTISAREIFQKQIKFTNHARLVVIGNSMPLFKSADPALLKRISILDFQQSFEDKTDPLLLSKLKKELPGIFNWILQMRDRIINEDGAIQIIETKKIKQNLEKYKSRMDSVLTYMNDKVELNKNFAVQFKDLYNDYKIWFKEEGLRAAYLKSKSLFKAYLLQQYAQLNLKSIPYLKNKNGNTLKNQNWVLGMRIKSQPTNCADLTKVLL
jgi:putative DNA primase/helicase